MISCITNRRCFLRHFLEKLKNLFTVQQTYNPYNPQKAYNIQEFLKFYTKDFNK